MDLLQSCALVFVFGFSVVPTVSREVNVLQDFRSWNEARQACQSQVGLGSCDLITKSRLNEEWSNLGLSDDDSYWVGGQYFYRWLWDDDKGTPNLPLFQRHGCYKLAADRLDKSRLNTLRYNGLHQCYTACENQGFLYLQGDNCYCASTQEGEATTSDHCNVNCTGSGDTCGAKTDYFSVYSISPEIHFVDEYSTVNCAVGRISNDMLRVQAALCNRFRHFFCESDLQADEIDARSESFKQAVYRCETRHGSALPTLSAVKGVGQLLSDLQTLSDKLTDPVDGALFWLPLRKHVRPVWVDGEEGEDGGNFGDCLAAIPRTASYRLSNLPCSQTHAAICACTSGTDPGDSGNKDEEETLALSGTVKAVIFLMMALIILAVFIPTFICLRRHQRAKHQLARAMEERFATGENPIYKG